MKNVDKIMLIEIVRMLNPMNFDRKYIWIINNVDINTFRNLRLTNIKKHWRFID